MKRVITSLVLIPVISYVILWAPTWLFVVVLSAIALACFHEYSNLVGAHGIDVPGPVGYGAGLCLLLTPNFGAAGITMLALVAMGLGLRTNDLRRTLTRAGSLLLGVLYVFGGWRAGLKLREIDPYWLVFACALNWVGDTAAFYVGRAIGRHKLAPLVSPGKSWEGAIASAIGSVIFAAILFPFLLPTYPVVFGMIIAFVANIAGQAGDLCESALKRGAGVKDSGTLLPGHGGWLDRVDSSLFAIPTVYLLRNLLQ